MYDDYCYKLRFHRVSADPQGRQSVMCYILCLRFDWIVQVNTSGEESKSGVEPGAVVDLAKYIKDSCPHLKFSGLMTIGMKDYTSRPENFQARLCSCRRKRSFLCWRTRGGEGGGVL